MGLFTKARSNTAARERPTGGAALALLSSERPAQRRPAPRRRQHTPPGRAQRARPRRNGDGRAAKRRPAAGNAQAARAPRVRQQRILIT